MKFQKLIISVLITVIICATLALGFQQNPLRLPNPFSVSRQTQEKNEPIEVKDLHSRITKLESKVAQLERTIEELQKPRVIRELSVRGAHCRYGAPKAHVVTCHALDF